MSSLGLFEPRDPGRFDAASSETTLEPTAIERFRQRLKSAYSSYVPQRLISLEDNIGNETSSPGRHPPASPPQAFPLSLYSAQEAPLNVDDINARIEDFFALVLPVLPTWSELPFRSCIASRRDVSIAVAGMSSLARQKPDVPWLCDMAGRVLLTSVFLDNRLAHSRDAVLTWLMMETMSALSGSADLYTRVHRYHGFLYSIAKYALSKPPLSFEKHWTLRMQTQVVIGLLIGNTVSSLQTDSALLAYTSLEKVRLEEPYSSIEGLSAMVIYGNPDETWPPSMTESHLLTLLVILNHILWWAGDTIRHRAEATGHTNAPSALLETNFSDSHLGIILDARSVRLSRALSSWDVRYSQKASPSTRALFHLCRLYLNAPSLRTLFDGYDFRLHPQVRTREERGLHRLCGPTDLDLAAHDAWSIIEFASKSKIPEELAAPWLPIGVYLSALYIWYDIKKQGRSRAHGSPLVLETFQRTLERMTWPCCSPMAECLAELANSAC